jgi:hypothetical protein
MRLVDKPVNIVFVLDGLPLALWLRLALLAHVNSVAFTRKLLVRPFAPADPAVMPHPGFLPATQKIIAILPYDTSAMREQVQKALEVLIGKPLSGLQVVPPIGNGSSLDSAGQ